MKKAIVILMAIGLLVTGMAYAEEEKGSPEKEIIYEAITEDYEETERKFIKVRRIEKSEVKTEWTLSEIDWYIQMQEKLLGRTQENLKNLRETRMKVEEQANKVRLKREEEKDL